MINFIKNWWQEEDIKKAINRQNFSKAEQLIRFRQQKNIKISLLEKLFLQNIQLQQKLSERSNQLFNLESILSSSQSLIEPDKNFINHIENSFKLINRDDYKIQCTGIDTESFQLLEINLVDYLVSEINASKLTPEETKKEFKKAWQDLQKLKQGLDPDYNLKFSSHVYLMQYFLENVYCNYLAYFLIYRSGYFSRQMKILDIAAGPGTMLFGLSSFIQALSKFTDVSQFHFSYYSLEQQLSLQIQGSKFWRRCLERQIQPINAYCQFNTKNLFDYYQFNHQIPNKFFDLIVISHCFFYDNELRAKSFIIYKDIFNKCLSSQGKILLIIQANKLYKIFDTYPEENIYLENQAVNNFINRLGLKLIWYKYLTSTGERITKKLDFLKFAKENLPEQSHLSILKQKYFFQKFISNYAVDDFVIFAEKIE
jgi:hypothetical protein